MTARTITMKHLGPIEYVDVTLPPGGVTVLRGPMGCGKSIALKGAQALVTGAADRDDLPVQDGADRATISGFGATLSIRQKVVKSGKVIEVTAFSSDLNLQTLVDGDELVDAEAADRRRVQTLLALANVSRTHGELVAALHLSPAVVARMIPPGKSAGLLETAEHIRRQLHAQAREAEAEGERLHREAAAKKEAAGPEPTETRPSSEVLTLVLDAQAAMTTVEKTAKELPGQITKRESLAGAVEKLRGELPADGSGPDLSALKAERAKIQDEHDTLVAYVAELAAKLKGLGTEIAAGEAVAKAHADQRKLLDRYVSELSGLADLPEPATVAAEVAVAQAALTAARDAYAAAQAAENRGRLMSEAQEKTVKAAAADGLATMLRVKADAIDSVLSQIVGTINPAIAVRNGRLRVKTDRGMECFADLSDGERWSVAIRLAAALIGENGFVVIPQPGWEGLPESARTLVANEAEAARVNILTAEVTDDVETLTPETYVPRNGVAGVTFDPLTAAGGEA